MNFILATCVRNGATAKYCLGDRSAGQIKYCAMPAHKHFCVPDCNNIDAIGILYYHFILFPKNKKQKRRWILAIKRDEGPAFKVMNSTVVCSAVLTSCHQIMQLDSVSIDGLWAYLLLKRSINGWIKTSFLLRLHFVLCKSLDVPWFDLQAHHRLQLTPSI